MVGGRLRRRRDLRPVLIHLAGWALVAVILGWLLMAGGVLTVRVALLVAVPHAPVTSTV